MCPFSPPVKYPIIRLLINREATRNLPWIHFLPRQNLDHKNTNTIAEALGKDGSNIFPFTATLDKKILHDLLYIFLRQTLTPLSTHIWWRKSFLCGFFPPSSFPSRYSHSQLTLISRKAFCGGNNLKGIFHLVNRQPATISSLVASAHKKSHQLCEMACFCCFITFRVFMLPVT